MSGTTQDAVPTVDTESLQDRLDSSWEKYLHHSDQYHQAQQQLSKHMSAAFFSSAQANFKTTSRVRYGQDYYDERMQAIRKTSIEEGADNQINMSITSQTSEPVTKPQPRESSPRLLDDSKPKEAQQQPTPPATPNDKSDDDDADDTEPEPKPTEGVAKPTDPSRWYGILVPPALRSSQGSFIAAVQGPVPEAINAIRCLRAVEAEIRKVRKEIKKAEKRPKHVDT